MASLKELIVKIGADTKGLDAGINSATGKLSSFGDKAMSVGGSLTTSLTAPIAAVGVGVLYTAGQFEASMNKMQGISRVTGETFTGLRDRAKELGATTSFSASEAAEGMIALSQAGLSADEVMAGIGGTLQLAAAGGLELGEASGIAATAMKQFGLDASEVGRVANVMAATASSAFTDIEQLSQALKFGGQSANSAGMSFEQTAAALAILAQKGDAGSTSGERLRTVLGVLAGPSQGARDALKSLHIAVADLDVEARGLPAVLDTLKAANIGTADAIKIFGVEAKDAARSLIEAGGSGFDEFTAKVTGTDAAAVQAAANMKGFEGAMKALGSATEGLAIAIAESGILEWATGLVVAFTDIVREIGKTSPELLKIGTVIAGVVAAAGPILLILGGMASGFAAIAPTVATAGAAFAAIATGPIGLSVAALAAVSAAVIAVGTDTDTVVGDWKASWAAIKATATQVGAAVVSDIKAAWNGLVTFSGPVFKKLSDIAEAAMGIVVELLKMPGIKESLTVVWTSIKSIISGAWTAISGIISGALDVILGTLEVALGLLKGDWQAAGDGLVTIARGFWTAIAGVFTGGYDAVVGTVVGLKNAVLGQFSDLGNELVGNSIVPDDIVDPTIGEFERMRDGGIEATETMSTGVTTTFTAMGTAIAENKTAFETWAEGIKTVSENLDIGGKIFSGAFAPSKWKETLKGIGNQFKDALAKPAIDAINNLIDKGIKVLLGALDGVIGKLIGSGGVQSAFGAAFGIGGGGGSGPSIPGVGGGGGGPGGAAGSIAGAGINGAVSMVTGAVSAVSGVISNFQFAAMNKSLDLIETETRETKLWIETNVAPALWQINEAVSWGPLVKATEALSAFTQGVMFQKIDGIFAATSWGPNVKANERSAEELSGLRGEIAMLAAKLEQLVTRDIVVAIDGQEIARAVGAGQESLRATA